MALAGMASHTRTMEVMKLVIEQERVITAVREAARLNGGALDQVSHHRERRRRRRRRRRRT